MTNTITLRNGKKYYVKDYISAKTKDLIDFGYMGLTDEEVLIQFKKVLNNEKLSVIGMFIKDDLELFNA